MSELPLERRESDCFLSYASEDAELARKLATWLTSAGLSVWFDQVRLGGGMPVLDTLALEIRQSRGFILLLTEKSINKPYVKFEVRTASDQQVKHHTAYPLIALRTRPDLDASQAFPSVDTLTWLELPNGELDLQTARRILLSTTRGIQKAPGCRHIYVSCGWGENDEPLTRKICAPLADRGVRLIGDALDQKRFGENGKERVRRLMSGCSGHLVILPDRRTPGKSPEERYKYFLAEWAIGREIGLSRRTFCVARDSLPAQLQAEAIEIKDRQNLDAIIPELIDLHDESEPLSPYVFLATDFKSNSDRNIAARALIEHVLGMECVIGMVTTPDQLREAIIEKILAANIVFADVASKFDPDTKRLAPNLNTCIEAGVAMGARKPVFVLSLNPWAHQPEVQDRNTQLPFMFRNSQIGWYLDESAFLAEVHRLARSVRRRIINDEIQGSSPA